MEKLIAFHCAPALAGIKAANIMTCRKAHIKNIHQKLDELNALMNSSDIYFEILFECEKSVLVMVYRRSVLEAFLAKKEINLFLNSFGYADNLILEEKIEYLKKRMNNTEFPHEIGAFLGYPLHDILGFIYHKNQGCILCGDWKVYKDAETAEKMFRRFKACKVAVCRRVLCGQSLVQIFCPSNSSLTHA